MNKYRLDYYGWGALGSLYKTEIVEWECNGSIYNMNGTPFTKYSLIIATKL